MSSNIFNANRFLQLWRQYFIHNTQLLFLSTVAYIGVIFIVLSISQISNQLEPHNLDNFQGFLMGFVAIFGILYVGHSFPAFRSKEKTMNYFMVPASHFEKFIFEFFSRIGIMLLTLPLLYYVTFHMQGYFFNMFMDEVFKPINIQYLVKLNMSDINPEVDYLFWIYTTITTAVLFAFVLAFTGAAMFTRQPLVKSLFAVAVIVIFYFGYTYIVVEKLGLDKYHQPESMWLLPHTEAGILKFFSVALFLGTLIMLFVAYRKLKEREV